MTTSAIGIPCSNYRDAPSSTVSVRSSPEAFLDAGLRALLDENSLLAEAAELSREAVTVDLHCHPNSLSGGIFPRLDPEVPPNMKAGGLDCGLFAMRGDYPVIERDSSGQRYERRQPRPDS